MRDSTANRLRQATEDDVGAALVTRCVDLPLTTPVEALEFFNCMLDQLLGPVDD
jgi:hypothetical protein